MSLLPYFPLASGLLTGKYQRNARDAEGRAARHQHAPLVRLHQRRATGRMVEKLERRRDAQPATRMLELAFGWLLAKPVIGSVIAGATTAGADRAERRAPRQSGPRPPCIAEIDAITR